MDTIDCIANPVQAEREQTEIMVFVWYKEGP